MLLLAPCLALLETEEEKQSFSVFFERYHRLVLKKARDVVKTQEAAEDVGQEVFLYAAEHFKKFQDRRPDEILHYLILCTASRASNYLKQDKRPEDSGAGEDAAANVCVDDAERIVLQKDTAQRALALVQALPERYRAPLELRLEGESYDEIAALLSLPRDTVYKRIQRGYQHVRERLVREDDQ